MQPIEFTDNRTSNVDYNNQLTLESSSTKQKNNAINNDAVTAVVKLSKKIKRFGNKQHDESRYHVVT